MMGTRTRATDGSAHGPLSGLGERLAALVPAIAEPADRRDQLPNAGDLATTQHLARPVRGSSGKELTLARHGSGTRDWDSILVEVDRAKPLESGFCVLPLRVF
jgi:hypothetical protein